MAAVKEVVATGFMVFRRLQGKVEYLLMHASYENNLWTPPKGHVEAGESEIETAYRETEEEAGLTRSHIKVLDGFQKTLRYPVRGKNKRVEYWLAELLDPNTPVILSNEHIDFKWLPLDDCKTFARFPEMIEAYEEAEKFIVTTN